MVLLKLSLLLFVFHTVITVKYDLSDLNPDTKISDIMPVHEMLNQKQNQTFFNAQIAKLKSDIEMYEQKIKKQSKENAKLMKRRAALQKVPLECQKIKCPFEEKPICAKFFHRDGKRPPFYVTVVNKCEMRYMKCRQGLEAKIVAKQNCHSILDTFYNPESVFKTTRGYKRLQARRAKRDINKDASMNENDINQNEDELTENNLVVLNINDKNTSVLSATTLRPTQNNMNKNTETENITTIFVNAIDTDKTKTSLAYTSDETEEARPAKITTKSKDTKLDISDKTKITKPAMSDDTKNIETANNNEEPKDFKPADMYVTSKDTKLGDTSDELKNITLTQNTKLLRKGNRKSQYEHTTKKQISPRARKRVLRANKTLNSSNLLKNAKLRAKDNDKILKSKADLNDTDTIENDNESLSIENNTKTNNTAHIDDSKIKSNGTKNIKKLKSHALKEKVEKDHLKNINGTKLAGSKEGNKKIARSGNEYLTKNTDKNNKMFKYNVFGDDNKQLNNDNEDEYDLDAYQKELEAQEPLPDKIRNTEPNGDESYEMKGEGTDIEGTIEIDDDDLEAYEKELEAQEPLPEKIINTEPNGDESYEMKGEGTYITGTIEVDDDDLDFDDDANAVVEKNDNDENRAIVNLEDEENAENSEPGMTLNDEPLYDPKNRLAEEPEVHDPKLNDDEYEFVPGDNEIIALSEDEDEVAHHEVDQSAEYPIVEEPDVRDPTLNDEEQEFVPGDNDDDDHYDGEGSLNVPGDGNNSDDTPVDKEEMNAECPTKCPGRHSMVCAKCAHGVYRTFLSICHMRMYSCRGPNQGEQLELVSHRACVMSAPVITNDPSMRPVGHLSLPGDKDSVLLYVRCRERGMLGKSPKCKGPNLALNEEIEENTTETALKEY